MISTQVRGVEGGVDSIMGLSTTTLAEQLDGVVAARRAFEERYPLVYPRLGPVLGRPAVARGRWAVVGDVFNAAKPASRVLARVGRAASCAAVSPYVKDGLTTVADVAAPDAVDARVAPHRGARGGRVTDRGVRFVCPPGADGEAVLAACRRDVVVQRGARTGPPGHGATLFFFF